MSSTATDLTIEQLQKLLDAKKKEQKKVNKSLTILTLLSKDSFWKGMFRKNLLTGQIVYGGNPPWGDRQYYSVVPETDIQYLICWIEHKYNFTLTKRQLWDLIQCVSNEHTFNPLQDYLNTLIWDGKPRLNNVLEKYATVIPRNQEHRELIELQWRTWMVGLVKRAYEPGCKFDTCFILDGNQYIGKSTFWRILASPQFFCDTPIDLNSKDSYLNIQGIWLYELAELDAFTRADNNRQKVFFSSNMDKFRMPYDTLPVSVPRATVFCGSTNDDDYLRDPTGSRRFFTATVTAQIDQEGFSLVRDQVVAEAIVAYRNKERPWLLPDDMDKVMKENVRKSPGDSLEIPIREWLESNVLPFYLRDIFQVALKMKPEQQSRSYEVRIGNILKKLGYKKHNNGTYSVEHKKAAIDNNWLFITTNGMMSDSVKHELKEIQDNKDNLGKQEYARKYGDK